ncbi:unnamed protein product [Malus baccata var. baccata]
MITTYSTAPSIPHIFPNKSQISLVRNLRGSCKATTINSDENPKRDPQTCLVKLDRRNLFPWVVELSEFPITLDSVISVIVPRPKKSRTKAEKEAEEEVLAIQGIEFVADDTVKFDVHVNDDEDALSRPDKAEFAGSFVYLPHKRKEVRTSLRLGITDLLEDLGADGDDSIKVTLVPKYVKRPVTVRQIKIEFLK